MNEKINKMNAILKKYLKQDFSVEINPREVKQIEFAKIEDNCFMVMLVSKRDEVIHLGYGKEKINLFDIPPEWLIQN